MNDLKNKVAIVTGATRGIGRAIAIMLLDQGCKVVGIYEKSVKKANVLESNYQNITMIRADIGKEANIKRIIQQTLRKYKGIDIIVNNAGINIWGRLETYRLNDWTRMLDVNVTSKFLMCKYAIPHLLKSIGGGVIINISSRLGLPKYTEAEFIPYSVNNAAINMLTTALSKELENTHIRVNAVIPTVTDTDRFKKAFSEDEKKAIVAKGKLGTPEEVACHVLRLIKNKNANGKILIDKRVYI